MPPPFCDVRSRAAAGAPRNAEDASRPVNRGLLFCPLVEASARNCSGLGCGGGGGGLMSKRILYVAAFNLMAPFCFFLLAPGFLNDSVFKNFVFKNRSLNIY